MCEKRQGVRIRNCSAAAVRDVSGVAQPRRLGRGPRAPGAGFAARPISAHDQPSGSRPETPLSEAPCLHQRIEAPPPEGGTATFSQREDPTE